MTREEFMENCEEHFGKLCEEFSRKLRREIAEDLKNLSGSEYTFKIERAEPGRPQR
jgi:hypothetical protein